jgi:2-succinyl-5-enolpyruvyl-6-hydroxy-3-cyclohexene-1-carboxylate synthase
MERFTESCDCVVYTNALSNCHGKHVLYAALEMTVMPTEQMAREYAPDVLISIGGQTGDYPFYLRLASTALTHTEHWRVAEDGQFMDTYEKLTRVFECTVEEFFTQAGGPPVSSRPYFEKFRALCAKTNRTPPLRFSSAYAAQVLHDKIPKNSVIQLSILHSLRVWNLFPLDPSITCYSNVGAFGIDGGMSTLIGQSLVTDQLCFMVIGDLAFYYDMNCLGIRHIRNNVRIMIVNNNGGLEFKLHEGSYDSVNPYIAAADHYRNARGWAETCGFEYLSANSKEEFNARYARFLGKSDKPMVFELFIPDKDDFLGYRELLDANQTIDMTTRLKREIKKIIRR